MSEIASLTKYDIDLRGFLTNSLVEWEGRIAAVVFTARCNWRCPYCHGAMFVEKPDSLEQVDPQAVFELLETQKKWLDGVAITGGEPTLQPGLVDFIRDLKKTGTAVKLETNGTRPEVIETLLAENLLDNLTMDYKAPLDERLAEVTCVSGSATNLEGVKKSFALAAASGIEREYHTTLCPAYIDAGIIEEMGKALEPGGTWFLQQYETDTVLNPEAAGNRRFDSAELDEIEKAARATHEKIIMRRGKGA